MMAGKPIHKPGQTVPQSGIYGLVGPRGGARGPEVTSVQGEPFPPTPDPGLGYKLVRPTKKK